MSVRIKRMWIALIAFVSVFGGSLSAFAQDNNDANVAPGFMKIVFGGGAVDIAIWMMLFAASAATLAFIIDAMISVKRDKLIFDINISHFFNHIFQISN